ESAVVRRAVCPTKFIRRSFEFYGLQLFLQEGFIIQRAFGRGCLDLFPDQAFYGATRCNVTAVQKYRPDDGLDRVRKQSMLFSASCFLFTAADAQELTDLDRLARIRECRGRDEMMLHQRQVALIKR